MTPELLQLKVDILFLTQRSFDVLCWVRDGDRTAFVGCSHALNTCKQLERVGLLENPGRTQTGWKLTARGRRVADRLVRSA